MSLKGGRSGSFGAGSRVRSARGLGFVRRRVSGSFGAGSRVRSAPGLGFVRRRVSGSFGAGSRVRSAPGLGFVRRRRGARPHGRASLRRLPIRTGPHDCERRRTPGFARRRRGSARRIGPPSRGRPNPRDREGHPASPRFSTRPDPVGTRASDLTLLRESDCRRTRRAVRARLGPGHDGDFLLPDDAEMLEPGSSRPGPVARSAFRELAIFAALGLTVVGGGRRMGRDPVREGPPRYGRRRPARFELRRRGLVPGMPPGRVGALSPLRPRPDPPARHREGRRRRLDRRQIGRRPRPPRGCFPLSGRGRPAVREPGGRRSPAGTAARIRLRVWPPRDDLRDDDRPQSAPSRRHRASPDLLLGRPAPGHHAGPDGPLRRRPAARDARGARARHRGGDEVLLLPRHHPVRPRGSEAGCRDDGPGRLVRAVPRARPAPRRGGSARGVAAEGAIRPAPGCAAGRNPHVRRVPPAPRGRRPRRDPARQPRPAPLPADRIAGLTLLQRERRRPRLHDLPRSPRPHVERHRLLRIRLPHLPRVRSTDGVRHRS